MIQHLKKLEFITLYYLCQNIPGYDWAKEKFEILKEELQLVSITETEIETLGRVTCQYLSTTLDDNVTLFRVKVEAGNELEESTLLKAEDPKDKSYWDFNPCTTLDVIFTSILLVIKELVDTPIYREFIRYTNLLAYVERFNVKFVKIKDAVDLKKRRNSFDFVKKLIKGATCIGTGGYAKVHLCIFPGRNPLDLPAGPYAVKKLSKHGAKTYMAEMVYSRNLIYKCMPRLFAYGSDGGKRHYLIMHYFPRGSLDKKIGELEYDHALNILIDVSDALHFIHTHVPTVRLIHDDVNPKNILLKEDQGAVLCDFGLMSEVGDEQKNTDNAYTQKKIVNGEVKYVRKYKDQSRDIYSLGIIMAESFVNESVEQLNIEAILRERLSAENFYPTLIRERIRNTGCDDVRAREIVELALSCIQSDGELCPSAHVVASKLKYIRESDS